MSYLVLARKYRPATFAEVVGQEHVTRTLENAFATGRVHHAFLFCGPRGCGKTTLARIVGKALNCQTAPSDKAGSPSEPCGVCGACTSISNGSSVDYQEMDGASNRGIDAIRELTEAVRYQPAVLRKKVYVIDEVHMLTAEAFNALLKTLEEPPPHVTFVLATTEPHKLPNTILSRCQRYDFKLVPASRLAQHLANIFAKEQLSVEPGALSLVVRESGGSVRDALSLCDQLISYVGDATMTERHVAEVLGVADRSLTRTLVRGLASGDAGAALAAVESAIERGVDEVQIARAIVRYLRDLSVLQVAADRPGLVDATDEELAELLAEAGALDRSRVTQMFERMLRCCDELGKTLQPRLVLDCALIDVATIEPLVPLGDLIERLTELEGRLAGRAPRAGGGGGSKDRPRPAPSESRAPAPPSRSASPGPISEPPRAAPRVERPVVAGATVPRGGDAERGGVAGGTAPGNGTTAAAGSSAAAPTSVSSSASAPASGTSAAPGSASAPASSEAHRTAATSVPAASERSAPVSRSGSIASERSAPVSSSGSIASERSAPVSMQPSGPVPRPEAVAAGSGPHDDAEPAAAKLAVPSGADDALRAWNQVLGELEALRKFSLLAPFQHARVMSWTASQLDLGFPVDVHSMGEMARDNADELRTILRTLGPELKAIHVTVRLLDASESTSVGARSVLETSRERTSAERSRREAEAREHPITKHVLQAFGAQIKEIKTDV
jgi:DNA polymerase III subunit gamma/tau